MLQIDLGNSIPGLQEMERLVSCLRGACTLQCVESVVIHARQSCQILGRCSTGQRLQTQREPCVQHLSFYLFTPGCLLSTGITERRYIFAERAGKATGSGEAKAFVHLVQLLRAV